MIREKIDENKKMPKEYNARGERMYENSIKRENAKNRKNKQKQDEKNKTEGVAEPCTRSRCRI